MFSSTSYAEWTEVIRNIHGDIYYVDLDRIKKHDGYIFYWQLQDMLKPDTEGDLSAETYVQCDCNLLRVKPLTFSFYKLPMGKGIGNVQKTCWIIR